jgi:hypothetical protein
VPSDRNGLRDNGGEPAVNYFPFRGTHTPEEEEEEEDGQGGGRWTVAPEGHHATQWFGIKRRGGCFGDSLVTPPPPLPLNDRLVHLRVSTVARRRKFQGEAFSAMGSAKALGEFLELTTLQQGRERERERVLVGQHHQQEMEEDDDAQSHDEKHSSVQQHSSVVRWIWREKKNELGEEGREGHRHTCRRHDLMESLYQVNISRRVIFSFCSRYEYRRSCVCHARTEFFSTMMTAAKMTPILAPASASAAELISRTHIEIINPPKKKLRQEIKTKKNPGTRHGNEFGDPLTDDPAEFPSLAVPESDSDGNSSLICFGQFAADSHAGRNLPLDSNFSQMFQRAADVLIFRYLPSSSPP